MERRTLIDYHLGGMWKSYTYIVCMYLHLRHTYTLYY
jgi:hypothetical protein